MRAASNCNPTNADMSDTLRLFYALWPDDATRTALQQLQAPMRGRTIPYSNLHLTLAFLGQQPATVLPQAKDILLHLSAQPIPLMLDRVGYFPRNRIAWIGMHQVPDELVAVQQELAQALQQRGIAFDNRQPFKPHVTLARDASLPPDLTFDPIPWRASDVALVQSITHAEGALYEVLASRSLDAPCRVRDERAGDAAP